MKNFLTISCAITVLTFFLIPQLPGQTSGGFNKSGRTALQFLKIGVGARQAAIGEAGLASVRDVNAVFWNPANLTGIAGPGEAAFSYARWFADLNYISGAASLRWTGVGVFALSYASLNYGDIDEALVGGVGGGSDTRTGNTFTGSDLLLGLSMAREFTDNLSIGVSAKFLQETLFDFRVRAYAFDVGTNYDVGYKGLRIAMSAQNFGPAVKWLGTQSDRDEGYDMPLFFRMGISSNLVGGENAFFNVGNDNRVIVSMDAIHTNDFGDRFHVGGEYWFAETFALRAGYRFNYDEGNWSFGAGLSPKLSGMSLRLDYAYVHYQFLDSPHRLTLTVNY